MIRPALIASACLASACLSTAAWMAGPAWPGELLALSSVQIVEPEEDDGSVAWIIHQNRNGEEPGEYKHTFEVEGYGTVVVVLHVIVNIPGPRPDTVTAIEWPPGLAVIPLEVTTDEHERSVLKIWRAGA